MLADVMITKPRVMLIPDSVCWILGTWAKEICRWNSDKYEFVIFPLEEIRENEKLFRCVVSETDILHCLTAFGFSTVMEVLDKLTYRHLTVISTVNHIVEYGQIEKSLTADRIVVICRKYYDELIHSGICPDKVRLVYIGVDTEWFRPYDSMRCRMELGLPLNEFIVGFSGKSSSDHDARKGIDILIEALRSLTAKGGDSIHLAVTGPGWERLKERWLGGGLRTHYFPFLSREKMPEYYNSLDAYVVTARVEGGPAPLLEAMSCGRAVITTPVGTALEVVRDGVNGLVVPIGDVGVTVARIEELKENVRLRQELGTRARETIIRTLQWQHTVGRMECVYGPCDSATIERTGGKVRLHSVSALNKRLIKRDIKRWEKHNALHNFFQRNCIRLLRQLIGTVRTIAHNYSRWWANR